MLDFSRDGNTVKISIETSLKVSRPRYLLQFIENDENNAELLKNFLEAEVKKAVEKARKESYDAGWHDAKSKLRKETWFSGWL